MSPVIHRFISADFATSLRGLRLVQLLRGITTTGQVQKGKASFKKALAVLGSESGCIAALGLPGYPQVAELLTRSVFSSINFH